MPTFLNLAKAPQLPQNIDGVDQWDVLSGPVAEETPSARQEILHNMDPDAEAGYVSYLRGDGYKYVNGTTSGNAYGGWLGLERDVWISREEYVMQVKSSKAWSALNEFAIKNLTQEDIIALRGVEFCREGDEQPSVTCDPLVAPCLFNVFEDACERNNLADVETGILREMEDAVNQWKLEEVPINNQPLDPMSNPEFHGNSWSSWKDDLYETVN